MSLYEPLADLSLTIEDVRLDRFEMATSSDFDRVTTRITFSGEEATGMGEDVVYETDHHDRLQESGLPFDPTGTYTVAEFSDRLDGLDLFPDGPPDRRVYTNYRRWGLESAALDLALEQAETDLASAVGRPYRPVRFVVSTRLGDPPSFDRIADLLEHNSALEFKLDPTSEWSPALIEQLGETDAVRILDLKGQYEGTEVDQEPDPALYERLVESFPDAVLEDPALTDETRPILDGHAERVSWDAPVTGLESIRSPSMGGHWFNIKPSRFGSVESLLESIEYCLEREITLYGGGQFELDVGREHLQALASLFYPDGPNDVAPIPYHSMDLSTALPESPLTPPRSPSGFSFG